MHNRAFSDTVSYLEDFQCERINTTKQRDEFDFSYVECFRSKDLSIWFPPVEGPIVRK